MVRAFMTSIHTFIMRIAGRNAAPEEQRALEANASFRAGPSVEFERGDIPMVKLNSEHRTRDPPLGPMKRSNAIKRSRRKEKKMTFGEMLGQGATTTPTGFGLGQKNNHPPLSFNTPTTNRHNNVSTIPPKSHSSQATRHYPIFLGRTKPDRNNIWFEKYQHEDGQIEWKTGDWENTPDSL